MSNVLKSFSKLILGFTFFLGRTSGTVTVNYAQVLKYFKIF